MLSLLFLSSCGDSPQEAVNSIPPVVQEVADEVTETEDATIPEEEILTQKAVTRELTNPAAPNFSEVDIDFSHNYNKDAALSFLWGTFIDLDSDGRDEIMITGWAGQNDAIFRYTNNGFVDITGQTGLQNTLPSYGSYSIDFNEDGQDDLFIARQDGIYYYENTNWRLGETKLNIALPANAVPLDIDFADIDGDNDLDIFVSTFITQSLFRAAVFNDPNHVQRNMLLRNDGDLSFSDVTSESWLDFAANTFTASFADMDNDADMDLVVSPNTDTVKIYENQAGKYSLAYEWALHGFWMGLGIWDSDNDGDADVFFSNVGTSISERLLQGDSNDSQNVKAQYLFLENIWNMGFREKKDSSFDDLGFGWWIIPTDINHDNALDFFVLQNYIKWPAHKLSKLPGELLIQEQNSFTASIKDLDIENKAFGISALVWDVNGDNFDDIVYLNLDGNPKAYIRNPDSQARFLKVDFPNTAKYIWATFTLLWQGEEMTSQKYLPKQGLMTKQSSNITFGLNLETRIPDSLKVQYQNGEEETIELDGSSVVKIQ